MSEMKAIIGCLCGTAMREVRPRFPYIISEVEEILGIPLFPHEEALDVMPMSLGISVCFFYGDSVLLRKVAVHTLPLLSDKRKVSFETVELTFHLCEDMP